MILITGGLGFIGCALTKKLLHNDDLLILDIDDYESKRNIFSNKITYIKGDVCDSKLLMRLFTEYSITGVIHLAAVSRVVVAEENSADCVRVNIHGIMNLLSTFDSLNQHPWTIFASSREVYGECRQLPVSESIEKKPINIYGESKLTGECLFRTYARKWNTSTAILRFSNVYGSRFDLQGRVLPAFIKAIKEEIPLTIEGGGQLIDFTYMQDTVDAIEKTICWVQNATVIDAFHILPGIGWTLYQAIEIIENALGKKAIVMVNKKRSYDVERFVGNPTKAISMLGLHPFHTLEEGVKLSIKEYEEI